MLINFQKNSITFSSTFFILAFSAIIFLLSACVVTTGRGPYYPQDAAARRGDLGSIQGLWFITASNYSGKLEFHWERGMWVGRVWFDAFQQWEPVTDIFFDSHMGEIQFTRVAYNQRYIGTLSGDQIVGTYTTPQGGTGSWTARRH